MLPFSLRDMLVLFGNAPQALEKIRMFVSIEEYNQVERQERQRLSSSQIQALQPVTFQMAGYPTTVEVESELARYTDLLVLTPHIAEPFTAGEFIRGASLYTSFSPDEAELINRLCDATVEMTAHRFATPRRPMVTPLTNFGLFRAVQAVAERLGKPQLTILDIGAGFGYLGGMLGMAGHRYMGVDITQSLYLWQNRLWAHLFGEEFSDEVHASNDRSFTPRRVNHMPWWRFARLFERAPLPRVDVIIANSVLCEMTYFGMLYTLRLSFELLSRADAPLFMFSDFGDPRQLSGELVRKCFTDYGFHRVLTRRVYGYSPAPERLPASLQELEDTIPQYRPSGRAGDLGALDFLTLPPSQAPDGLAFNNFVVGWTPPLKAM